MWLNYGIGRDGELVPIERVQRGKTDLQCPYCQGQLTAKKGEIKRPHFAHTNETCRAGSGTRDLELPLFDRFDLHLSRQELDALLRFYRKQPIGRVLLHKLAEKEVIEFVESEYSRSGGWNLSKLGKIIVRELSMMLFAKIQEPLILKKLARLQHQVLRAWHRSSPDYPDLLTDLKIYRAQIQRVLLQSLYYLKVTVDDDVIFKIGVTIRTVPERVAEIERELGEYFRSVAIEILGIWEHRGNLEPYFIYKYDRYRHKIGTLTEYFKFEPELSVSVLRGLRRIGKKKLVAIERNILDGTKSQLERYINRQERSVAIKTGMSRAKQWGTHVGRPIGSKASAEEFLAKPTSVEVVTALDNGLSVRMAAKAAGVSPNTVAKVKAAMAALGSMG